MIKLIPIFLSLFLASDCFAAKLTKEIGKQVYKTSIGAEADEVIIGDSKTPSTFKPQITFTKWNKENSLTIKVPDGLIASTSPTLSAGKVEVKDSKTGFYFNADPDNSDNFKFGLVLYQKPLVNSWSFQLEGWEEFDFFYQPPLTQEEIDNGDIRPDDVIGSYAVYHKAKKDNQYQTGKFSHIYRPKFIDANGAWVWGELNITNGIYTVTCPQSFLDTAVYPVKANDTFGNTGVGGSSNGQSADQPTVGYVTLSVNGSVTKITAYCSGDYVSNPPPVEQNGDACVYSDNASDPNVLQGSTNTGNIPGDYGSPVWRDYTFGSPLSLNSGNYWLGIWGAKDFWEIYYDVATSEGRDVATGGGYTFPTWPDPWPVASDRVQNQRYSIYATYTPTAARRIISIQ